MSTRRPDDRHLMFGEGIGEFTEGPFETVIPVWAHPEKAVSKDKPVDVTAIVITGDVPEALTPFEQAQQDFNGSGAFLGFDQGPDGLFPDTYEI